MRVDNVTISLELLFLNELLETNVIDNALFDRASNMILKEAESKMTIPTAE
ncbi:MAG: hypothetical protein J5965_04545 [Aeriscardovia sp.]|nr:hypothetical protein [Aeriscardovia sp.]